MALFSALATLALTSTLAALPIAGDESGARDAIKLWRDASRADMAVTAMLALRDLAGHDSPLTVDTLLAVLENELAVFHPAARQVLGGFSRPETLAQVARRGLEHRDPRVRAQVLLALSDGRPAALDWQLAARAALSDPAPEVRAAGVRALGRARSVADLEAIVALLTDTSVRVRQELPEAVTRLAPVRALPLLEVLALDAHWRVRAAVVRALAALRTVPAAQALVDLLGAEQGRLREDALLALTELTGRNFGLSAPAWRRYLEVEGSDGLEPAGLGDDPDPDLPSVTYYGLGTLSKRFVLVTDLSGSMGGPASAGYRTTEGTRLQHTQDELVRLIGDLADDVAFNLVTFTDTVVPWRPRLVPATEAHKQRALAEIEDWVADGGTNLQGALEAVFDLAERELDDREDGGPDTVFLLSDGEPSAGVVRDTELLLLLATERNRDLHLRIHCISLTSSAECRDFLVSLASATGGRSINPLD